nr:phosphodiesterase [Propionibacterium sp.]
MTTGTLPKTLKDAIVSCGFFPDVITTTLARALGGEEVRSSVVHHEATFDRDEFHRHVTVLLLTPRRLLVSHTDDGEAGAPQAMSTLESIPLRSIRSVALTNVVPDPARFARGQAVAEVWLSVGWGALRRVEIVPANCGDPHCEADHGYDAQNIDDDLTVRMSTAADGEETVRRLIDFATALQLAVA